MAIQEKPLESLLHFKVGDAHCYDPNEELRLRQIIAAVGEQRFNERIRNAAAQVASRRGPQRHGSKVRPSDIG